MRAPREFGQDSASCARMPMRKSSHTGRNQVLEEYCRHRGTQSKACQAKQQATQLHLRDHATTALPQRRPYKMPAVQPVKTTKPPRGSVRSRSGRNYARWLSQADSCRSVRADTQPSISRPTSEGERRCRGFGRGPREALHGRRVFLMCCGTLVSEGEWVRAYAVSYTHLTLPTICSV